MASKFPRTKYNWASAPEKIWSMELLSQNRLCRLYLSRLPPMTSMYLCSCGVWHQRFGGRSFDCCELQSLFRLYKFRSLSWPLIQTKFNDALFYIPGKYRILSLTSSVMFSLNPASSFWGILLTSKHKSNTQQKRLPKLLQCQIN